MPYKAVPILRGNILPTSNNGAVPLLLMTGCHSGAFSRSCASSRSAPSPRFLSLHSIVLCHPCHSAPHASPVVCFLDAVRPPMFTPRRVTICLPYTCRPRSHCDRPMHPRNTVKCTQDAWSKTHAIVTTSKSKTQARRRIHATCHLTVHRFCDLCLDCFAPDLPHISQRLCLTSLLPLNPHDRNSDPGTSSTSPPSSLRTTTALHPVRAPFASDLAAASQT